MSKFEDRLKIGEKQNLLVYSRVQTTKSSYTNSEIIDVAIQHKSTVIFLSALPYVELVDRAKKSLETFSELMDIDDRRIDFDVSNIKEMNEGKFYNAVKTTRHSKTQNINPKIIVAKADYHDLSAINNMLEAATEKAKHKNVYINFTVVIDEADMLALNECDSVKDKVEKSKAEIQILKIIKAATNTVYVTATPVGTLFNKDAFKVDSAIMVNYPQYVRKGFKYFDATNSNNHGVLTHVPVDRPTKYDPITDNYYIDLLTETKRDKEQSLLLITNSNTITQHKSIAKKIGRHHPDVLVILHNEKKPSVYLAGLEVKNDACSSIQSAISEFKDYKHIAVVSGVKASRAVNVASADYERRLTDQYLVVANKMDRANLLQRCRIFGQYEKDHNPRLHCSYELWNEIENSIWRNDNAVDQFISSNKMDVFRLIDDSGSKRAITNKTSKRGINATKPGIIAVGKLTDQVISDHISDPLCIKAAIRIPLREKPEILKELKTLYSKWIIYDDVNNPEYREGDDRAIAKRKNVSGDLFTMETLARLSNGNDSMKTLAYRFLTDRDVVDKYKLEGNFELQFTEHLNNFTFINLKKHPVTNSPVSQYDRDPLKSKNKIWSVAMVLDHTDMDNAYIEIRSPEILKIAKAFADSEPEKSSHQIGAITPSVSKITNKKTYYFPTKNPGEYAVGDLETTAVVVYHNGS